MIGAFLLAQVVWLVEPPAKQPTLAPHSCPCVDCKCDPCDCHAKAKPQVSVKKQYTPAEASVQVRASKGKEAFQCSGTAIDTHTVISCWHVTRPGYQYTINGKPATLLRSDSKSDVALFTTEDALKPVPVANEPLRAGEACHGMGYEFDKKGKLWKFPANVVGINRYRGFPNVSTRGRDPVLSGRSGGGLFNSKGELVGVCSARDGADGLYCGLDAIKAIINGDLPKIAQKAFEPKQSTPNIVNEWMQDPNCKTGQCPLIKKQAPAAPKAISEVGSGLAPRGLPGLYYTRPRWGRR